MIDRNLKAIGEPLFARLPYHRPLPGFVTSITGAAQRFGDPASPRAKRRSLW